MVVGTEKRRTVETIQRELEFLAKRHGHLLALKDEEGTSRSAKKKVKERKKILEARHASREFHGNYEIQAQKGEADEYYLSLFDEFARAVCHTAVIPRKELFECWAMALYVHYHFPSSPEDDETEERRRTYFKRVADMGCGQGLVSWAILFLDKSRTRTAIGIDKKIPKSTDAIESVMKERHPSVAEFEHKRSDDQEEDEDEEAESKKEEGTHTTTTSSTVPMLEPKERHTPTPIKRWHWVEGDICQNVSADKSTLIVGVHCCGTLSDTILDMAISSRSALALVPCCHTKKSLPKEYHHNPEKIKKLLAEDAKKYRNDVDGEENPPSTSLTDYIDRCRIQKLIDAGYEVEEERIPSVITPKNRIIVATPLPREDILPDTEEHAVVSSSSDSETTSESTTTPATKTTPGEGRWEKPKRVFTIPLADTPSARSTVASQSGRLAADLRQRKSPPNLSMSLYFSDPEATTPQKLNELTNAVALEEQDKYYPDSCASSSPIIVTSIKYGSKGPFSNPDTGMLSRSFHVCYKVNDPTGRLPQVTKMQAKELHKIVCKRIEDSAIPGVTLRQGIR